MTEQNTFDGLNAIADEIEPLEPDWKACFEAVGDMDAYDALVAATRALNAVIEPHVDEIARITGNSASTLRQVYNPRDEIESWFGTGPGPGSLSPSQFLRNVAKFKSFNIEYWKSKGWSEK